MATVKQEVLIRKLNPILRGFANYYQGAVSKETFGYIKTRVWQDLWNWCKRRHLKRRLKWVKDKYFRRIQGVDWTFCCDVKGRRDNKKPLCLYNIHTTPIVRHIKVKGTFSPFDGELDEYWEKRQLKQGKTYWAKGSKYLEVAKQQNWKCPNCCQSLFNGEDIERVFVNKKLNYWDLWGSGVFGGFEVFRDFPISSTSLSSLLHHSNNFHTIDLFYKRFLKPIT